MLGYLGAKLLVFLLFSSEVLRLLKKIVTLLYPTILFYGVTSDQIYLADYCVN